MPYSRGECGDFASVQPRGDWERSIVALVAADSFPFPGGDRTSERKASERRSTPGVSKKFGEKWGGGERLIFRTPSQFRSLRESFLKCLLRRLSIVRSIDGKMAEKKKKVPCFKIHCFVRI